jgi:YD repeat-containing protein
METVTRKSETDHSGKTTTYKPDEAGNVYEKTNRLNEVTRYTFDNANRLTRADYLKDNSWETFGYDPAGNPASSANAGISAIFQFDRLNRLERKIDSRVRSLAFSYDAKNRLTSQSILTIPTGSSAWKTSLSEVVQSSPATTYPIQVEMFSCCQSEDSSKSYQQTNNHSQQIINTIFIQIIGQIPYR